MEDRSVIIPSEQKQDGIDAPLEHEPGQVTPEVPNLMAGKIFEREYAQGKVLGQGGFGTVYAGIRIEDQLPVAIKIVKTGRTSNWIKVNGQRVPREVFLLRKVSHVVGVIQLIDYFERPDGFIMVMERPDPVMDLFDYISEKHRIEERKAKGFFRQIVDTVKLCHEAGVVHRDIKDENILVNVQSQKLKLIDFGAAANIDQTFTTFCGTPVYAPPEYVRLGEYNGRQADVWTLGTLLYNMVTGICPFETNEDILSGDVSFPSRITSGCRELIRLCLRQDPEKRATLEEILGHDWMKNSDSNSSS